MHTVTVSTDTLQAHLDDPNWVIVDVRFDLMNPQLGRQSYAAAHIPNAQFMDLNDDLASTPSERTGRHPLPQIATFAAKLGAMGIDAGKQVVVYDGGSTMFVGRLWWMLRWLGHDAVAVLDGGYAAWEREGRTVSSALPSSHATTFVPRVRDELQVSSNTVLSGLAQQAHVVIDARAPERYSGAVEPIDAIGGHIPGALNRPFVKNVGSDGKFIPTPQLRAEFEALLGGRSAAEVVHSCGSGVSAIANMIAMEAAGLTGSRLYVGSWSEWSRDPSRPTTQGLTPC
jgi:thiosulfate/3-mercaptopyruvate sulfurtransferase